MLQHSCNVMSYTCRYSKMVCFDRSALAFSRAVERIKDYR